MGPLRTLASLAAGVALAAPLSAQVAPTPYVSMSHAQSTGPVSNDGPRAGIVAEFIVAEEGISSMRLHFDEVQLAAGSELLITSLHDGHQQTLDAEGLRQWQDSSAYFNGNAVHVALIAQPGTGSNLVSVGHLDVAPGAPASYETQCGPVDDREPSDDPRVARLLPVGCTAWIVDDCAKCFISAGHCGLNNTTVEFNVPFSSPSGAWNHPPPSDQYAIDPASVQGIFGGSGNDWMYFGTFVNSTSGLTAYETQGDAFELTNPPPVADNDIRITGHGTDSTPDQTYNQIQQTHVGPLVEVSNIIRYQTDTTGGNSGSPVIWEQTGQAIGVHTNGGCSTSGSGSNFGTPVTAPAWQDAMDAPQGVCAAVGLGPQFGDLGESLVNSPFGEAPVLGGCGDLTPHSAFSLGLDIPAVAGVSTAGYLVVGIENASAPFKGGTLVPSPDAVLPVPIAQGVPEPDLVLPGIWPVNVPSGASIYMHFWMTFSGPGGSGFLASNGLSLTAP